MTHLAAFLRGAEESHYKIMANTWHQEWLSRDSKGLENQLFWVSTSGLGVSWLHVRFDTFPKYYNWHEYKARQMKSKR